MSKKGSVLFHEYFKKWIKLYKVGAVRSVTLKKYKITCRRLAELAPDLTLEQLNRMTYQQLLNDYALTHEKQTTMDFHHQLKACVLDAFDEGRIKRDPTRKVVVRGKMPADKKKKYLSQIELKTLINELNLKDEASFDWLILLVSKTGLRFAEALAVTPRDFDFTNGFLTINKTWNYKEVDGGFQPTKNDSSNRKIQLDWQLCMQFSRVIKDLPDTEPIFVHGRVFNSTVNDLLERHCKDANITIISVHGLRHTHASMLLFSGVSIASVAKRLGHSNMAITQKTYLHIIDELENKDAGIMMSHLAGL